MPNHTSMFVALLALTVTAAGAQEPQAAARRLAQEGAPELALARVESLQPPPSDRALWAEWEVLRVELLERLGRDRELARRAGALPADAPPELARTALAPGARAALKTGQPALARDLLARLLWQAGVAPEGERAARLLVIDSYLEEKRPAEAYRAMLRFQQDFLPLARAEGEKFAQSLARQGLGREAATWLTYLDESDPAKLQLQLETGLVTPDAAAVKARAALRKPGASAGYWQVLALAAERKPDAGLRLEATEQLLNQPADGRSPGVGASGLWEQYVALGEEIANREQLLRGDDAAWLELAARLLPASPHSARAVLAALSAKAATADARGAALSRILASLQRQKLALAAARLAAESGKFQLRALDAETRHALGAAALDGGETALAVEFWRGLPAPPNQRPEAWQVRVAAAALKAGLHKEAGEALQPVFAASEPLPREVQQRVLTLAQEASAQGQSAAAEAWLAGLLPLAEPASRREALFGLGRLAEARGDHRVAAGRFLDAALALDLKVPDAAALDARMRAARSLALAGYRRDAKAQWEWVAKYARDKALQDLARREMERP